MCTLCLSWLGGSRMCLLSVLMTMTICLHWLVAAKRVNDKLFTQVVDPRHDHHHSLRLTDWWRWWFPQQLHHHLFTFCPSIHSMIEIYGEGVVISEMHFTADHPSLLSGFSRKLSLFSAGQEKWLGRILSIICIVVRRKSWLPTDWTLRLEKTRLMSRDWSGGLKRFDRNTFSTARSHHVDMLVWSLLSFRYKIPPLQCFIGLNLNRASKEAIWNWNQLGW